MVKLRHNMYGVGGGKITGMKAPFSITLSVNDLNTTIKTDLQNTYIMTQKDQTTCCVKKDILEFQRYKSIESKITVEDMKTIEDIPYRQSLLKRSEKVH